MSQRSGGAIHETVEPPQPSHNIRSVFIGLMLGMLIASVSQTIVAPGMPRIVADLGGLEHYSWIAVSALLASAVAVPIVGKLSDLYGRKHFYVGGIMLFMAGSVIAGLAQNLAMLIVARIIQGVGMGTIMPLSQAIIGDIISARERGKYQGLLGGVFGLAAIVGPLVGGYITDTLTWRWLFFVNLPVGVVALGFIIPFMQVPHIKRARTIDYWGMVTLSLGLITTLLATVSGGVQYPWGSPQIIGLYTVGVSCLIVFVLIEMRVTEPVLPLRLWKNSIFTFSNIANMSIAMSMFGAIYFIPVFIQGVIGSSATESGAILIPMTLAMVCMSIINGQVVSRTGYYKVPILLGVLTMAIGFFLLTQMDSTTSNSVVVRNMILIGLGLGTAIQTFVLIVQNAVSHADLGVATATTQLFRSLGATAGVAILGTVLAQSMARELPRYVPAETLAAMPRDRLDAGAVFDPTLLGDLPPALLDGIRLGLAAALHDVFVAGLPFVAVAFIATLFIKEIPLRRTVHADAREAGKEVLAELNQANAEDEEPVLGQPNPAYQRRTRLLGIVFGLLAHQSQQPERATLRDIIARLGDGDETHGQARLCKAAAALARECVEGNMADDQLQRMLREIEEGRSRSTVGPMIRVELGQALSALPADLRGKLRALRSSVDGRQPVMLTPEDLDALERVSVAISAALLLDLADEVVEANSDPSHRR